MLENKHNVGGTLCCQWSALGVVEYMVTILVGLLFFDRGYMKIWTRDYEGWKDLLSPI